MKSVQRRHPELKHATPQLTYRGNTSKTGWNTYISEALTHSDTITTKTYVNTSNVIPMAVGELPFVILKNNELVI